MAARLLARSYLDDVATQGVGDGEGDVLTEGEGDGDGVGEALVEGDGDRLGVGVKHTARALVAVFGVMVPTGPGPTLAR